MALGKEVILIFISMVFVNNFVFAKSLGLCPYLGVSKKFVSALGMGLAVVFVMTLASIVTWILYAYILIPLEITFLYTIVFILVIATLVQLVEMILEKTAPALYHALGIYLPLITTNCAVLGIAVLNKNMFFTVDGPLPGSFIKSVASGIGCGIGFCLALLLMSGIRERLEFADVPPAMKNLPIAFVVAGLIAIAFMGFM